jgi:nitrate reductase NapAB chaperone NapD
LRVQLTTTVAEVLPLLLQAHPQVLTAIGELMLVLDESRIITEEELGRLENFR